jgi:serine protease Do
MQQALQIRHSVAAVILAAVLATGGILGVAISSWAGHPVFGASQRVPMFIARPSGQAAGLPGGVTSFASILKPDLQAVVNISSSKVVKTPRGQMNPFFSDPFFRQFFGNQFFHNFQAPREQREQSLGSGVIVSPDGYILTNNHVISGATEIKVYLPDKRQFKGKVVGTDPKTDIAVVKIAATNLPTITMGDSSKIQVGDLAFAIGDPFGIGETATMGIVSATGRNGLDIEDYEDFIQTDAAINPGNSGGALVNVRGELIGINTAILSNGGGGNQGIGFAIPIDMARRVMDEILKHGKVVRGYLGVVIQEVTPDLGKAFHVPEGKGALIGDVTPDGPAAKAGLQKGDVIEDLNGKAVDSINDLRLQIASMAPGTVVHLKVLRNGQPRDVSLTLGELPEKANQAGPGGQSENGALQGVQVENLTPSIARDLGVGSGTKGVVVTDVAPDTPAAEAGLQRGDVIQEVNRQPLTSVSEYNRAVSRAGNQTVVLLLNRGGQTSFVVVQPE